MRSALFQIVLICLCGFLTCPARSQEHAPQEYWLQHFTDDNGLPQNSVKAIAQDKNGFIWLTTEDGLVRFDGHRFITFDRSVIPVLTNRIRGFVPSIAGGQARHEFYALSERNEYIGVLANGLASVDTTFYEDYLNRNPRARGDNGPNTMLASIPVPPLPNPFAKHYFVAADNQTHYIWEEDRVVCFQFGKPVFTINKSFRNFILIGKKPYGVDSSGNFKAIGKISRDADITGDITLNPHYHTKTNRPRLFWNNISRQAFLYLNNCLYLLNPTGNGNLDTKMILSDFDFDNLYIAAIYFDEQSRFLFLGSTTKGLFLLKRKNFQTHKLPSDNADNVYYAQLPVRGRAVLTAQGYIFSPDGTDVTAKKVSSFMEKFGYKFAMAQNWDSTFWFGIGSNLYKLDQTGQKILAYVKMPDSASSLYVDPTGRLWIGCDSNALYILDESKGKYTPRRKFTLASKGVMIIDRENADTLLLGMSTGLYRLNTRTGISRLVTSLDNATIRSFYTTPEGTWITTYGSGFYLLNQNKLVRFPLDKDRFLATSHCIVEDRNGFFWITTNRGLFQVAKKRLLDYAVDNRKPVFYLYYDKQGGFETNEFNGGCQPCALALADGTVSLPSMDGLVWFKPETNSPELPDKGIFINAIREDDRELVVQEKLKISRDFEQLRFTIATPYMGNSRNIQMQYSLSGEGRAEKWTPVNADLIIPISKVPYGDYVLTIRKVSGFKANDYIYKTVRFHIPPAWYETWWFKVLMVLAMAGLFFVSVRLRSARLVKKEREANMIRHYRVLSQIIAAVNHDIQTPLHYIGFSLKQFNTFVHKHVATDPLIVRMSDETLSTSQRLNTLTKNILDYIKLQSRSPSERLHLADVNTYQLVSTVSELFAGIAIHREVTITNTGDQTLTVFSDPNLLSIIIHNLIDNALKMSQSQIKISSHTAGGLKRITIEDDGGGMPQNMLHWLNKNYKSYEDWLHASQNPDQKGIGLVIVKDLCVLLGIEISVSLPTEKNTAVVLTFTIEK
ncbi:Signal transduction histidine kinase [Dyadobacter sp. SG02]|uniref:sensor histidine kinase n=1 Tax=Dyadobacter sp. SG02 TaxID=1855291 RepID=UPI0008D60EA7|nr:two-component regulator propeller domain-containing protein [Dyadobacter sp. SG02]SEJ15997.1 Signal transduction histidine kinase [Dyadobacter sp. SG02]